MTTTNRIAKAVYEDLMFIGDPATHNDTSQYVILVTNNNGIWEASFQENSGVHDDLYLLGSGKTKGEAVLDLVKSNAHYIK